MSVSSQKALKDLGKALTLKAGEMLSKHGELVKSCFILVGDRYALHLKMLC